MSYEAERIAFQKALADFTHSAVPIEEALQQWGHVAGMSFAQRRHRINGMAVFPHLWADDPDNYPNPWIVSLYGPRDVERHWGERRTEGFGGDRSFLIGWLDGNGSDDAIFVSNVRERRVAVLHHEEVFAASHLDTLVSETATDQVLPVVRFVELLHPE